MTKLLLSLVPAAILLALPLPSSADSAVQDASQPTATPSSAPPQNTAPPSAVQDATQSPTQAPAPPPAPSSAQPSAGTPRDYYKLGQFFATTINSQYMETASMDLLQRKLAREQQILVNLGATQPVLNAYTNLANTYLQLPFTIPWTKWTQNQQNAYLNTPMDWNAINAWLPAGDSMPRFYFWLGYQTLYVVKTGPLALDQWNFPLATVQAGYQEPLADFKAFATVFPNTLGSAPAAVQQAIQRIATYSGTTPSTIDIANLQTQGEVIYETENGKSSPSQ